MSLKYKEKKKKRKNLKSHLTFTRYSFIKNTVSIMNKKAATYLTQIYLMQVPLLSQRTNFDVTVLPIQKQSLINILRSAFQFFPTEKGKQRYGPSNFSCYRSNTTYKVLDRVFSLPTTGCPPPCHRCPPRPRTTSPLTSSLLFTAAAAGTFPKQTRN